MAMVATTEQRVEEMHARIFQLNRSVGRSLCPPPTCARLRHRENVDVMTSDWRARAFVVHAWNRRGLARSLLRGAMPAAVLNIASNAELIRGVYHCLPRQLFRDVGLEKVLIANMQSMSKVLAFKPTPPVALAVGYFKERLLPGAVFSMPSARLPESMRQRGKAPQAAQLAAFQLDAILDEAVALAAEPLGGRSTVAMGMNVKDHRFFRVVKTNLASRFVQFDNGRRSVCISVCELQMTARHDQAGLQAQSICISTRQISEQ